MRTGPQAMLQGVLQRQAVHARSAEAPTRTKHAAGREAGTQIVQTVSLGIRGVGHEIQRPTGLPRVQAEDSSNGKRPASNEPSALMDSEAVRSSLQLSRQHSPRANWGRTLCRYTEARCHLCARGNRMRTSHSSCMLRRFGYVTYSIGEQSALKLTCLAVRMGHRRRSQSCRNLATNDG